jgi:hypothetical protein
MSSGGGKTSTTVSGPPKWAEPYYKSVIGQAQGLANKPFTPYSG